jgi:hypothetical protein
MRSSVVLPQPEGPSRVKNSPTSMAMLTLSTAFRAPKRRETLRISRSAMNSLSVWQKDGADYTKRCQPLRPMLAACVSSS